MMARLWEIDHPYYCSESNYFSNDCYASFKNWASYAEEAKDEDLDYNLIFRWDWREDEEWGAAKYTGDDNYRNGLLSLYYISQRKGLFRSVTIEVCRADEEAVIAFLRPRLVRLLECWSPISPSEASASALPPDTPEIRKEDEPSGSERSAAGEP